MNILVLMLVFISIVYGEEFCRKNELAVCTAECIDSNNHTFCGPTIGIPLKTCQCNELKCHTSCSSKAFCHSEVFVALCEEDKITIPDCDVDCSIGNKLYGSIIYTSTIIIVGLYMF